jgi:uncharacterized protein (TIGR03435 family)
MKLGWRAFILFAMAAGMAAGQSPDPQFEVASVKESAGTGPFLMNPYPDGRFVTTNVSLRILASFAFQMDAQNFLGFPSWWESRKFDIQAQAPGNARPSPEVLQAMMRSLLKERFALTFHTETRRKQGLAITANGKNKLKPGTSEQSYVKLGYFAFEGVKASIPQLAKSLTTSLGLPVRDDTGLTGGFDFILKWEPPNAEGRELTIFTAIQEQLGLRLRAEEVDQKVLVIDHVESPSAN